ncbi:ORF6N domain-containing protein [Fibrobacter succinogenes subsp. elongatus]|uniref:ORF6N domain-containing protein n=1 Tax=Fibrobacter succinogenes TaxID=833 RepID=A0A380S4N6_FIBSU|nr:ORF6N domain-containing protein [Fibrobacter succinogenes subsp. elongatus]SUQ24192.1 ORF6N domain-containing protein [Fibrobacter succinogenes]
MTKNTKNVAIASVKSEISLIDENLLKSRIYTIRGVKVMLDADLAEIYGYSTGAFNRQVKNNIERFAEDFRFQLSKREVEELRCKNCTANISTMNRSYPFVFTEQGIYMLMTVLKGDLAIQQSMALIRLFKQMKDYIVAENQQLLGTAGIAQIAAQTAQNTHEIAVFSAEVKELSGEVRDIRSDLGKINMDLQMVMKNFVDPSTYKHFLILNGQKLEADVAYAQIYGMAKKTLLIVDNYVDIKTLNLLRNAHKGVSILIASDQYTHITDDMLNDFRAAMPGISIDKISAAHKFHDRYILIDIKTKSEKLYHCGASSKDAGNKITTIVQLDDIEVYRSMFEELYTRQEQHVG